MKDWPQPFWAILLALLGVLVVLCVVFHPMGDSLASMILQIASNLISGALGAFAGHAVATGAKTDVTTGNAPVTVNAGK